MRFPHLQSAGETFSKVIHPVLEKLGNCDWFNIQYLQSVTLVFMFCTLNSAPEHTASPCLQTSWTISNPNSPVCQERALGQAMRRLRRKTRWGDPASQVWATGSEWTSTCTSASSVPTQQMKGNMALGSSELKKVTEGRDGRGAQCVF